MTVEEDIYNCTEITYDGQVIREDDDGLTPEEKKEQQYKKNKALNSYFVSLIVFTVLAVVIMLISYLLGMFNDNYGGKSVPPKVGGKRFYRK